MSRYFISVGSEAPTIVPANQVASRTYWATVPFQTSMPSGIAGPFAVRSRWKGVAENGQSREVIFGSRIRGAKIRAEGARERAKQAVREADRAEAWSIRMEGYGGR